MKPAKLLVPGLLVVLAVLFVLYTRYNASVAPYPKPGYMPPVVADSMDHVLTRLEAALAEHAPELSNHLQPGLPAEQVAALEQQGGFHLSDELRALYQWRNGVPSQDFTEIFPIHRFLSLEEVVETKKQAKLRTEEQTLPQRAVYDTLVGHMDAWLPLFEDGAGNGYFFDPTRKPEEGALFSCFLEMGDYRFFPSLKNVLNAIAECYEAGAYSVKDGRAEGDFHKSEAIWDKYGAPIR